MINSRKEADRGTFFLDALIALIIVTLLLTSIGGTLIVAAGNSYKLYYRAIESVERNND